MRAQLIANRATMGIVWGDTDSSISPVSHGNSMAPKLPEISNHAIWRPVMPNAVLTKANPWGNTADIESPSAAMLIHTTALPWDRQSRPSADRMPAFMLASTYREEEMNDDPTIDSSRPNVNAPQNVATK